MTAKRRAAARRMLVSIAVPYAEPLLVAGTLTCPQSPGHRIRVDPDETNPSRNQHLRVTRKAAACQTG